MIAIERRGRLGNHMFQFAFGLAAARRLGTEFVTDETELRELFVLEPHDGLVGRVRRAAAYRRRNRSSGLPVLKIEGDVRPDELLARLTDETLYAGFFQSAQYFAGFEDDVRRAFTPRSPHLHAFQSKYRPMLEQRYVCCHIRATDYRHWLDGVALPMSYYRSCLAQLESRSEPMVVFVGDDLTEARAEFHDEPNVTFEENSPIVDLLLLRHASAVVTSNSSFGWWGAWLGSPDRSVFAPRDWLGFKQGVELPRHVLPPNWTQVPVSCS